MTILSFTLCSLKNVNIKFHNKTTKYATTEIQQEIINTGKFPLKSPIIFLNKKPYITTLEKTYPYLKVINIETIFPNSLTIHCKEREQLYSFLLNGIVYSCDKDLKILEKENNTNYESTQTNNIFLQTFSNLPTNLEIGDFIDLPETKILKNISPCFEMIERNLITQKALIKQIKISETDSKEIKNKKTFAIEIQDFRNLKTIIYDADNLLIDKIYFFSRSHYQVKNPKLNCLEIFNENNSIIGIEEKID